MKIRIELTLDVDEVAYAAMYGIRKSQVRDHARAFVRQSTLVSGPPIREVRVGARVPGGAPGMVERRDGYRR